MKNALISVSDKTGIAEFARGLENFDFQIFSTGGTFQFLKKNGVKNLREISELTNFPEGLDGRIKTLHPRVFGGILNLRENKNHQKFCAENNLKNLDLIAVNLYPFEKFYENPEKNFAEKIEQIDIGGPSMLRAAAKNFEFCAAVVDPADYKKILEFLKNGEIPLDFRKILAAKVFEKTAIYDLQIAKFWAENSGEKKLRYGENPHQSAVFLCEKNEKFANLFDAKILNGKKMSFNNFVDADAALRLVQNFPADFFAAIFKHGTPCCAATSAISLADALQKSLHFGDEISAFGGVVVLNQKCDEKCAEKIAEFFNEIVLAPDFSAAALEILRRKKNLRLLQIPNFFEKSAAEFSIKKISGGFLLQNFDNFLPNFENLKFSSEKKLQKIADFCEKNNFKKEICGEKIAENFKIEKKVAEKFLKNLQQNRGEKFATEIFTEKNAAEIKNFLFENLYAPQKISREKSEIDAEKLARKKIFVVKKIGEKIIAAAEIWEKSEFSENFLIGRFAVAEKFRGQNFGKNLVENIFEFCQKKGAQKIAVLTRKSAEKFWEKCNFKKCGEKFLWNNLEIFKMEKSEKWEILPINSAAEKKEIFDFRYKILFEKNKIPREKIAKIDAENENFFDFAVRENGEIAASVRFLPRKNFLEIQRFSVAEKFRGQKIGATILKFAENFAAQKKLTKIAANAQNSAKKFFEKFGFCAIKKNSGINPGDFFWMEKICACVATKKFPTNSEIDDAEFSWKICKFVKSNAIVVAKNGALLAASGGQTSRIDAAKIALQKSGENCRGAVLASDAFFPFADVAEISAAAGIFAIVQPGGAMRDAEILQLCDEKKIAMIFTGARAFLH